MRKSQKDVATIRKHNKWKTDPRYLLLALQEELGELSASFLAYHAKDYRKNSKVKPHPLEEELGDLLHLLLAFANEMDLDCESSLETTNKKLRK